MVKNVDPGLEHWVHLHLPVLWPQRARTFVSVSVKSGSVETLASQGCQREDELIQVGHRAAAPGKQEVFREGQR